MDLSQLQAEDIGFVLEEAVEHGRLEILEHLLDASPVFTSILRGERGNLKFLVTMAAESKYLPTLCCLLHNRAHLPNGRHYYPQIHPYKEIFRHAVLTMDDSLDVVKMFIEYVKSSLDTNDLLWSAYQAGRYDIVDYLLRVGFSDTQESYIWFAAACSSNLTLLRTMLQTNKISVDAKDPISEMTALQIAVKNNQMEAVKFLLDNGASLYSESPSESVILDAIRNYPMLQYLLGKFPDAVQECYLFPEEHAEGDMTFRSLLGYAIYTVGDKTTNAQDIFSLLLELNSSLRIAEWNPLGQTLSPLYLAVLNKNAAATKALLQEPDVNPCMIPLRILRPEKGSSAEAYKLVVAACQEYLVKFFKADLRSKLLNRYLLTSLRLNQEIEKLRSHIRSLYPNLVDAEDKSFLFYKMNMHNLALDDMSVSIEAIVCKTTWDLGPEIVMHRLRCFISDKIELEFLNSGRNLRPQDTMLHFSEGLINTIVEKQTVWPIFKHFSMPPLNDDDLHALRMEASQQFLKWQVVMECIQEMRTVEDSIRFKTRRDAMKKLMSSINNRDKLLCPEIWSQFNQMAPSTVARFLVHKGLLAYNHTED